MRDTCICKGDQDTCGIHLRYMKRYMYLKCILKGTYLRCGIHEGSMQDTCGIHVSSEVIKIHARYMRDTCGDTCSDTCGTRISGVRGDVHVLMPSWRAAHLSGHPCLPCAEMGLLQHPPAPPSSALSWPPLSQEYKDRMYKDRSTRSTRTGWQASTRSTRP